MRERIYRRGWKTGDTALGGGVDGVRQHLAAAVTLEKPVYTGLLEESNSKVFTDLQHLYKKLKLFWKCFWI
jgi:hypothetical protein